MELIINDRGDKIFFIHQLFKFELLTGQQIRVINTTAYPNKGLVISKMVAYNLYKDVREYFFKLLYFMESHWTLRVLLNYWKKSSENH